MRGYAHMEWVRVSRQSQRGQLGEWKRDKWILWRRERTVRKFCLEESPEVPLSIGEGYGDRGRAAETKNQNYFV